MLITIATPHSGHFAPQYVSSLTQTLLDAPSGFEWLGYEGCYVHSLRNLLMEHAKGDFILFIDSDMAWKSQDIVNLVKTGKEIVGGLYYKRRHPYGPVVYSYNGHTFNTLAKIPERLFQCDGIGTGFLMVSRRVMDHFKDPEYRADWGFPFDPIKAEVPGDSGSYYTGEDLSFCGKARSLGYEIWCDPETLVTHVGSQEVRGPL